MTSPRRNTAFPTLALAFLLAAAPAATALGQAGLGQRLRDWPLDDQGLDLQADLYLFADTQTEADEDFELNMYKARGRARLDRDGTSRWDPTIGFDLVLLDIDSDNSELPERLTRQRIGVGARLGELAGWNIEAVAGAGFAGETPYADGDAWHAHATLAASKPLDERSRLMLALNWDGNRAIFPDLPLPSVVYQTQWNENLSIGLGLPYSSVKWTPTEKWELRLAGLPPISVKAIALYKLNRMIRFYGSFDSDTQPYQLADTREGDRLFFQQRRLEAGVIVGLQRWLSIRAAGGYAFSQEFSRGWHVIDTDQEIEIDSAPYLKLTADLRF